MNIRLNAKATLMVAAFFCAFPFGHSQVDQTISQSNPDYILFEAEDFSDKYNATDGDSKWNATDEGIRSSGVAKSSELLAAKVVYKLKLLAGGNYTMYVRYKTDNDLDDASFYVSNIAGSPFGIGKIETTGLATYQWFNVVRITGFTLDDEQTLVLFPDIEGVSIDKILLHNNGSLDVSMIDDMGLSSSDAEQSSPTGLFGYGPKEGNTGTFELDRNNQGAVMNNPGANQKYFAFNGSSYYTLNGAEGIMSLTFPNIGCFKNIATGEFQVCFWWMAPAYASFTNDLSYRLNVTKSKGGGTTISKAGTVSNTTITANGFKYNKVVISSTGMDLSGNITGASLFLEVEGANSNDLVWIDQVSVTLVDDGSADPYVPPMISSLGVTTTEGSPVVSFGANLTGDLDGIKDYFWDFGDGNTATTKSNLTSHTYTTFGTFTVTLTAFDEGAVSGNSPTCRQLRVNAIRSEEVTIPEAVFLPVELANFDGKAEAEGIRLNWLTVMELNNDYFSVEYSRDAIYFEEIARVEGAGTTQLSQSYSFLHSNPQKGWNYYRLRQQDFDGAFAYSEVVPVQWESDTQRISLSPNPAGQHVEIRGLAASARVIILDIQGRMLQQLSAEPGGSIDIQSLNEGVYIARIFEQSSNAPTNIRFVKK